MPVSAMLCGPRVTRILGLGARVPKPRWYSSSASAEEIEHFSKLAPSWWDVNGSQRILHKMNLARLDYMRDTLDKYQVTGQTLPGYSLDLLPNTVRQLYTGRHRPPHGSNLLDTGKLRVLDVGCGGGILSESMARLTGVEHVTGIDLTPDVVEVARLHKSLDPMLTDDKLQYKLMGIEDVPALESYDLITLFEILEHVDNPSQILTEAMNRLKPGGWLFLSTINRTAVSYLTTIFMGEHILKIVPQGTHTWSKYINEQELRDFVVKQPAWQFVRSDGCTFVPTQGWVFNSQKSMGNYFMAIMKRQ